MSESSKAIEYPQVETGFSSNPRKSLRQLFPLQARKIIKKCIWSLTALFLGWIGTTFILFEYIRYSGNDLITLIFGSPTAFWVFWTGSLVVLVFLRTAYQISYFLTYNYDIEGENLIIQKGVIAKSELTVPLSKITDVYVNQDMLDVVFRLFDLHISTPTVESGRFAHIDGLNKVGAENLKRLVLQKMKEESGN